MSVTQVSVAAASVATRLEPTVDARDGLCEPDIRHFSMLVIPLGLFLLTFRVYHLEQPPFFKLCCVVFAGFAVSYWLPVHWRESFCIVLSLAGAFIVLNPAVAGLLIIVGAALFGIVRAVHSFRSRVLLLLGILAVLVYGRATANVHIPEDFWPVLGAMFMFRMIIYMYDIKHRSGAPTLKEFLSYFFLLPNYYFVLFPVVDFQTFRRSYLKRNMHLIAQEGVMWIFRGTTHLLLYEVIFQTQGRFSPPMASVATAVAVKAVFSYLLYLRVSGQFHIAVGMLHLFGYDLPETNRRYLLAHSINDLWRRINIYWKDFMMKIVYLPAYFELRKKGELLAQLLATTLVVVATWFLHAYQFFWLRGHFRVTVNDTVFWITLGTAMVVNVWIERKRKNRLFRIGWGGRLGNAAKIAATFGFMAILWSMWSAESLTEWFHFLRSGSVW